MTPVANKASRCFRWLVKRRDSDWERRLPAGSAWHGLPARVTTQQRRPNRQTHGLPACSEWHGLPARGLGRRAAPSAGKMPALPVAVASSHKPPKISNNLNPKTVFGLCARRGSAFGSAGILPAKRMHWIVRAIFAGRMPALPEKPRVLQFQKRFSGSMPCPASCLGQY